MDNLCILIRVFLPVLTYFRFQGGQDTFILQVHLWPCTLMSGHRAGQQQGCTTILRAQAYPIREAVQMLMSATQPHLVKPNFMVIVPVIYRHVKTIFQPNSFKQYPFLYSEFFCLGFGFCHGMAYLCLFAY